MSHVENMSLSCNHCEVAMPKFDISTVADGHTSRERVVFPNLEAAAEDVQRALVDMADERLPDGSALNLATEVRDEDGRSLYRALLQFRAQTADEIEASERQAEKDFASLSQALGRMTRGIKGEDV